MTETSLRYAFSTLACPRWSIEQVADAAVQMGYAAVELRLLDGEMIDPIADRSRVTQAVSFCRTRNVDICAFGSSCTFNHADARERERQLGALLHWIELAHHLSVPIIRVFGGRGNGGGGDEAEENGWVAHTLRHAVPEAKHAGVIVALETHDAFSSARRVAAVLREVNAPSVAALWDSHHPYECGESADEVVQLLDGRIAHAHVKDARRTAPGADTWQLVPIGEGEVPVAEMLAALKRHGYAGYVSVEWEKKWHPDLAEPEVALPQHIAWLKALAL